MAAELFKQGLKELEEWRPLISAMGHVISQHCCLGMAQEELDVLLGMDGTTPDRLTSNQSRLWTGSFVAFTEHSCSLITIASSWWITFGIWSGLQTGPDCPLVPFRSWLWGHFFWTPIPAVDYEKVGEICPCIKMLLVMWLMSAQHPGTRRYDANVFM